MPLKCSEFWRGWGNRLEQQLRVICRIMRLVDESRIMRLEGECGHSLILLQSVDSCGAFLPLGSTRERLLQGIWTQTKILFPPPGIYHVLHVHDNCCILLVIFRNVSSSRWDNLPENVGWMGADSVNLQEALDIKIKILILQVYREIYLCT